MLKGVGARLYLKTWCFIIALKKSCVRSPMHLCGQMGMKALLNILGGGGRNSGIEPHILAMKCVN